MNTTIDDGEDDKEEYKAEDVEGQEVCQEEGEEVVCVIQHLLCSIPHRDDTQRKKYLRANAR